MKIKTLFIAPYAAMENLIEECGNSETELDLHVRIGNLQEGVNVAKKAAAEGIDVIISRGGTAKMIEDAVDIPVVDVHISGYDMLRILTLANDFSTRKAIVGFSNITSGAKAITDLSDMDIDIFTIYRDKEIEPLVKRLKAEGYQLIMGDVITVQAVSKIGLNGILIQSGREAIFEAFNEAKAVHKWNVKNRHEIDRLKAILSITSDDLIVLDKNGKVVYEHWNSFTSRPLRVENLLPLAQREKKTISHLTGENGIQLRVKVTTTMVDDNAFAYLICVVERQEETPAVPDRLQVDVLHSAPNIIHQSQVMKTCLMIIERNLDHHFVFIGEKGTGKELLAKYVHYNKYHGSGLFASVMANDLVVRASVDMDQDVKTIFVTKVDLLDGRQRETFLEIIETLKRRDLTVILSAEKDQPAWGDIIYGDDTVRVHVPSLTERKDDISELVTFFIAYFNQTMGTSSIKIQEKGLDRLKDYGWPGNVAELKALIKDAVLVEKGYVIENEHIERLLNLKGSRQLKPHGISLSGTLEDIEQKIIETVLKEENFNQTKAAKRLNINRSTLWRKLKK